MTPCGHLLDWLVATIKYRPEAFLQRVAMNEFHKRYRRTAILRPVVSATLALLLAAAAVGGAIHVFRVVERQMPASCGMPNSTMSVSSSRLRPCGVTPESVPIATHTPALMAPHRL